MVLQVEKTQFPFPTESDLGVSVPEILCVGRPGYDTVSPLEIVMRDMPVLSSMIRLKFYFEISPEDMAEVKEKKLIMWPVIEQLFKIKEEKICQS